LRYARDLAIGADLPLTITYNSPARRRGGQRGLERIATLLGFTPSGAVLSNAEPAYVLRQ